MRPVRRMVVGVATLREEDVVLAPALEMAMATGAALDLVHAVETPEDGVRGAEGVGAGRIHRRYLAEARGALEEQVNRYARGLQPARVVCRAAFGGAAEVLRAAALRADADLVVVGATRRGVLARAVLGTTAQRVLHRASCPVMIVHPSLRVPVRRVLLTTDLSRLSARVHEEGVGLVRQLFPGEAPALRSLFVEEYAGAPPGEIERLLADSRLRLAEFLRESPVGMAVEARVRLGHAAREIASETVDWFPDLLVLGTHGRTGASRALLGSVAEAALRNALCSVLVIPAAAVAGERPGAPAARAAELAALA